MDHRSSPSISGADGLARSASAILAGSGVALASSLALRVVLARALDPALLGSLLLAISIVSFAGGTASLGLRQAVARRVAALRAAGHWQAAAASGRTALLLAAGAGALVSGAGLACLALPSLPATELAPWLLAAVAPVGLGLAVGAATWGLSQGHDDTRGRALVRDSGGGLLRLAAVAGAVLAGGGLLAIALGWALGSLLAEAAFVAYAAASGWLHRPRPRWDRELVASLPPFAGATAVHQTRTWLDMLLLGAVAPLPVVGLYGLAQSVWRVLLTVATAAAHRFLPLASAAAARGEETALAAVHRRSRDLAFVFLWTPLAPCLLCPGALVAVAFGGDYAAAAAPLQVLAAGLLVPALVGYGEEVLVARDRAGTALRLGLVSALLTAALLVPLAVRYGALGAALATSAGVVVRSAAAFVLLGPALRRATLAGWGRLALGTAPALLVAATAALIALAPLPRLALITLAATPPALLAVHRGLER